jgi:hypothetical protein
MGTNRRTDVTPSAAARSRRACTARCERSPQSDKRQIRDSPMRRCTWHAGAHAHTRQRLRPLGPEKDCPSSPYPMEVGQGGHGFSTSPAGLPGRRGLPLGRGAQPSSPAQKTSASPSDGTESSQVRGNLFDTGCEPRRSRPVGRPRRGGAPVVGAECGGATGHCEPGGRAVHLVAARPQGGSARGGERGDDVAVPLSVCGRACERARADFYFHQPEGHEVLRNQQPSSSERRAGRPAICGVDGRDEARALLDRSIEGEIKQ